MNIQTASMFLSLSVLAVNAFGARAPVPKVTVKCSPTGVGILHCEAENIADFKISWIHNNKDINEETLDNPFQPKQQGDKDRYRCRLSNRLDKQDSGEVTISCRISDKCTEKLEGDSHTIVLNSTKQKNDLLTWKCNNEVIYQRSKEKVQSTVNVDDMGSLYLKNLTRSMSCTYYAEHQIQGKLIATKTEKLCVIPRAPVPKLAVECSSTGSATLRCEPKSVPGFTLSWVHNNKDLKEKSNPLQLRQQGEKDLYRCRLNNSLDKQESSEVTISCKSSGSGPSDDKLFAHHKQMTFAILAGGGFLILVLILSLVVVSCKNCRLRKRKPGGEQLRLCSLKHTSTDPPQLRATAPEDQGSVQTTKVSPDPAACQPSAQLLQPPVEKDPGTPVPQPRTKLNLIPKTQDSANSDSS